MSRHLNLNPKPKLLKHLKRAGLREDLQELASDLMQLQLTQRAVEEAMIGELENISMERKRRFYSPHPQLHKPS
jgi:hypothetical protein